ncbi:unnamed protein product [Dicrocoelium dendriticum]|nr:unnamed protein product [Dicrocoelium dendriticum]
MALPPSLKSISMFIKCAEQHDARDVVIAYYCRLCAFQKGYGIDPSSPDSKAYLTKLMSKLEEIKSKNLSVEGIASETIGLAHLESYALKLFQFAYQKDLNSDFSRPTVQSFWTAGVLLDVATTLGCPTEELEKARKYAKWKAIYITGCQKNGETPLPGPTGGDDSLEAPDFALNQTPIAPPKPTPSQPPAPSTTPAQLPTPSKPAVASISEDSSAEDSNHMSPELYASVEKSIRYALSALEYQDKETVISYLQKALQMLSTS